MPSTSSTRARLESIPPTLAAAVAAMSGYPGQWAVAGGWALDLALGTESRPHADVDLAVFRDDQTLLRSHLANWKWEYVSDEGLVPWPGDWIALPHHELYATSSDVAAPLELLLNERDGSDWRFRRDPRVRLPLARAIVMSSCGIPVLAPEVVLLFKSKQPRAIDDADFHIAIPQLNASARSWLDGALALTQPEHPWRQALSGALA